MKKYQFLDTKPAEADRLSTQAPLYFAVPFGPEHDNTFEAEEWLAENSEEGNSYILVPTYYT
jgi:hypothetical protein